jgi:hypothetical protein
MIEIKAFVAHSFRDSEKELIQIFIDYLNTLQGILPGFGWEHARRPSPLRSPAKC